MSIKRIASMLLAWIMILSVLLSSVSCDALISELLASPELNEALTNGDYYVPDITDEDDEDEDEDEETDEETDSESDTDDVDTDAVETDSDEYETDVDGSGIENTTDDIFYTTFEYSTDFGSDDFEDTTYYPGYTEKPTGGEYTTGGYGEEWTSYHYCKNYDGDHYCDECGRQLTFCAPMEGSHDCKVCGQRISDCNDKDWDYTCDTCGAYVEVPQSLRLSKYGIMDVESYAEDGIVKASSDANSWLAQNRASGIFDVNSIAISGWVFIEGKEIAEFGYRIDNKGAMWCTGKIIDSPATDVYGENAKGFRIQVDFTDFEIGKYVIYPCVKDTEGKIYWMDDCYKLYVEVTEESKDSYVNGVYLPAANSSISIEQALEIGNAFGKNEYTDRKYYITGTVTEITNTTYGNMYISDGVNTIYIYGLYDGEGAIRYGDMDEKLNVGDVIRVFGVVGSYTQAQIKNAWLIERLTESNVIELYDVTEITGHITERVNLNTANWGVIYGAVGETDERGLPILYEGCFKVGGVDLSECSKIIVTYAMDGGSSTTESYNKSPSNNIVILSESVGTNFQTNGYDITDITIASGTYDSPEGMSWRWCSCEIDVSSVDYSGPIYITIDDFLPGVVVIFKSVTLVY